MSNLKDRLDFAVEIARKAGDVTQRYFGQLSQDQRRDKSDGSPVTVADRESETLLRELISGTYPDDAILGEEFPEKTGTSPYQWVIDPIDGTISFVQGVPLYGTMLACLKDGEPILGVIHMPILDETVYAASGHGCWHSKCGNKPETARFSETRCISEALVNTTSMTYFRTPELRNLYERLDSESKYTRGWSDCYAWVLLATGRVDAVIEPELKLWDFAAAIPIIQEAGGIWSDLGGNASLEADQLIAANPALHGELLRLIENELGQVSR